MLAKGINESIRLREVILSKERATMKSKGCTLVSPLLDRIRTVGTGVEISLRDFGESHNLEAEMARKVEGWD